jgi:hypothetical protein
VHNLGNSTVLHSPQLIQIVTLNQNNQRMSSFTVTAKIKPAATDADDTKKPAQQKGKP